MYLCQHCHESRIKRWCSGLCPLSSATKISAESAIKYSQALNIPLHELRPDLWTAGDAKVDDEAASETRT